MSELGTQLREAILTLEGERQMEALSLASKLEARLMFEQVKRDAREQYWATREARA